MMLCLGVLLETVMHISINWEHYISRYETSITIVVERIIKLAENSSNCIFLLEKTYKHFLHFNWKIIYWKTSTNGRSNFEVWTPTSVRWRLRKESKNCYLEIYVSVSGVLSLCLPVKFGSRNFEKFQSQIITRAGTGKFAFSKKFDIRSYQSVWEKIVRYVCGKLHLSNNSIFARQSEKIELFLNETTEKYKGFLKKNRETFSLNEVIFGRFRTEQHYNRNVMAEFVRL